MLISQVDIETITNTGTSTVELWTLIFAGSAAVLALASIVVGVWQQKRDHEHEASTFLREKRLETYSEMLMHQNSIAGRITAHLLLGEEGANEVVNDIEIDAQLLSRFHIVAAEDALTAVVGLRDWPQLVFAEDHPTKRHTLLQTYNADVAALAEVFRNSLEK